MEIICAFKKWNDKIKFEQKYEYLIVACKLSKSLGIDVRLIGRGKIVKFRTYYFAKEFRFPILVDIFFTLNES